MNEELTDLEWIEYRTEEFKRIFGDLETLDFKVAIFEDIGAMIHFVFEGERYGYIKGQEYGYVKDEEQVSFEEFISWVLKRKAKSNKKFVSPQNQLKPFLTPMQEIDV